MNESLNQFREGDADDEELRTHPRESWEYAESDGDVLWYEVEHNKVVTPPMYIGTKKQMAKHCTASELEELFWTPLPRLYRKTPLPQIIQDGHKK